MLERNDAVMIINELNLKADVKNVPLFTSLQKEKICFDYV